MIDSLISHIEKAKQLNVLPSLGLTSEPYGVVTIHRPTHVDSADILMALTE